MRFRRRNQDSLRQRAQSAAQKGEKRDAERLEDRRQSPEKHARKAIARILGVEPAEPIGWAEDTIVLLPGGPTIVLRTVPIFDLGEGVFVGAEWREVDDWRDRYSIKLARRCDACGRWDTDFLPLSDLSGLHGRLSESIVHGCPILGVVDLPPKGLDHSE